MARECPNAAPDKCFKVRNIFVKLNLFVIKLNLFCFQSVTKRVTCRVIALRLLMTHHGPATR